VEKHQQLLLLTTQEFAVYLAVDYIERHSQRPQSWLDMPIPHANPSTWISITTLQDSQISQIFMEVKMQTAVWKL